VHRCPHGRNAIEDGSTKHTTHIFDSLSPSSAVAVADAAMAAASAAAAAAASILTSRIASSATRRIAAILALISASLAVDACTEDTTPAVKAHAGFASDDADASADCCSECVCLCV